MRTVAVAVRQKRSSERRGAFWNAVVAAVITGVGVALTGDASAQTLNLKELLPEGQGEVSGRIIQMFAVVTILAVAPGILVTVTCFTRFVIALSFLRSGLGLPSIPSNIVLVSLALFMTFFVMGSTFDRMWVEGVQPLVENRIDEREAYQRMTRPLRDFMQANVRETDMRLFEDLAKKRAVAREIAGSGMICARSCPHS